MATTLTDNEKQTGDAATPESTRQSTYVPRFDIWEGEDELLLFGDLPGVAPDDLDIRFENRELTITGKVAQRGDVDRGYREYGVGDFHRTFTVGESIDAERITADMQHGVLQLRLPKSEKVKPRRIKVQTS